jgi:hypothetical protein
MNVSNFVMLSSLWLGSQVLNVDLFHMFALEQLRNALYDIATKIEFNRDIGILVRFIDSGTDGESHDVAVEQHGCQSHSRIRPHIFRCKSLFEQAKDFAQCECAFRDQVETVHPCGGRHFRIELLPHIDLYDAIQQSRNDVGRRPAADHLASAIALGQLCQIEIMSAIEWSPGHHQKRAGAPKVHDAAGNIVFRGQTIDFFRSGDKDTRQFAG